MSTSWTQRANAVDLDHFSDPSVPDTARTLQGNTPGARWNLFRLHVAPSSAPTTSQIGTPSAARTIQIT
jgi:hypothetical protein